MIKNLIVSGDSFSYGGVGGCPPTVESTGGCSYIFDPSYQTSEPNMWDGFLAKKLSMQSLVNTATASHGNILVSYTIFELLKKFNYRQDDTLIIFNLSDPSRFDIPCDFNDKNADDLILWSSELLDHRYLKTVDTMTNAVEKYTSESIRFLMEYLTLSKFNFYFLMMNNYKNHQYLGPIIDEFKEHLIELDPGPSMMEFAAATKNTISDYDYHPNVIAHEMIANTVYEKIFK